LGAIYGASDLALTRAGGGTFELLAAGLPLILVPYPYSAGDHQRINAGHWQRGGAGVVIADGELDGESLAGSIDQLMSDKGKLKEMSRSALALAKPQAGDVVAKLALSLMEYSDVR